MTRSEAVSGSSGEKEPKVKKRGVSGAIRFPYISTVVLSLVVLVAIFAPLIAPHNPEVGQLSNKLIPPVWQEGGSSEFLLGTDTLGRDIFTRILYGARVSLMVALVATGLAGAVGATVGLIAGFYRGWTETILMRITDVTLALPLMLMAIVLVSLLGANLINVLMVIVILLWPYYARQIRGEALAVSEQDYIDLGAGGGRVQSANSLETCPTQRDAQHRGAGDPASGADHSAGGLFELFGSGHSSPHARLGSDGGRRARPAGPGLVGFDYPRHSHLRGGVGRQPVRGLGKGSLRSQTPADIACCWK